MWFVMLGIALALLVLTWLYLRRRLGQALTVFGVRPARVRLARIGVTWLLLGYPAVMVVTVIVTLLVGAATMPRFDGPVAVWMLVLPFALSALVALQALPHLALLELFHLLARRRLGRARADRVRAVGLLVVLGLFALYTPARIVLERGEVRLRTHALSAVAPSSAPPLRIAFLGDLQQDRHTDAAAAARVVARINAAAPDLILAGGDWINTGPDHIEAAAASAGALRSRLGTWSVRGDHEHFAYLDQQRSVGEIEAALARRGVTMLHDEVRWFEHAGKRLGVLFLEYNYLARAPTEAIEARLTELAPADYAIVVTHQLDDHLAALLADRVDLVLSAHTHGGQVNPVLGLWHVPLSRVESRFVDGRYRLGRTTVIVTAGIGFSIVPFRYASPGSVELLELRL